MRRYLTKNEETMMNIFWESEEPLTSVDIAEMDLRNTWSRNYIQNTVRALLQKNMIKECPGKVQYHTQYARRFVPNVTKEDYVTKEALSSGLDRNSVAGIAAALVREVGDEEEDRETIQKLEEILRDWKASGEKKKEK